MHHISIRFKSENDYFLNFSIHYQIFSFVGFLHRLCKYLMYLTSMYSKQLTSAFIFLQTPHWWQQQL
jgi:hypothetical protein